jgi:hypothetical protein
MAAVKTFQVCLDLNLKSVALYSLDCAFNYFVCKCQKISKKRNKGLVFY